jgi:hypothetical protein
MKEIELTQGKVAIVDDADFEWLNQWKWTYDGQGYAYRHGPRPKRKYILMHREIMQTPKGLDTDHRDRNGLNNQRDNLRVCTFAQNQWNRKIQTSNTSGYKGVSWSAYHRRWHAQIRTNNIQTHLGYFDTPEEAAKAYDEGAQIYHDEFAFLNGV